MRKRSTGSCTPLTRRLVVAGVAAFALAAARPAAARQDASESTPGAETWTFLDDAGVTIERPATPERVVAYLPLAAALADFGLQPVGYYGIALRPDGTRETLAGDLEIDGLASFGETYGELDLELLVSLAPDLIVNDMWEYPPSFWGVESDVETQVRSIAPIANLLFIDQPITATIARVEELAGLLGADLSAPEVSARGDAFEAASAELHAAIAEKPGLTVAFVSGTPELSFWVGNPSKLADLRYFQELGLDIVQPESSESFSEELSWEQAGKYPADLFFVDDRQWSATGEELAAEVPTFGALPAAKAGAFAPWTSEFVPSYAGFTPVLQALATAIRGADPDIVP